MIKKFFIFAFVMLLLLSCGKKGDPVYNQKVQTLKKTNYQNFSYS